MNDNEARIYISEFYGWKLSPPNRSWPNPYWTNPDTKELSTFEQLPDWLNDLNATHRAEKKLSEEQKKQFVLWLADVNSTDSMTSNGRFTPSEGFNLIHATARQRADAILKTITSSDA